MKYLSIFNYTDGTLTIVNDPELEPNETEDVYENYIVEHFNLKPSEFHYMIGVNLIMNIC